MHWGTDADMTIVKIDVDADELDRHELGTIGVCGDAGDVCRALLAALDGHVRPPTAPPSSPIAAARYFADDRPSPPAARLPRLRSATCSPTTASSSRTSPRSASPPTSPSTSVRPRTFQSTRARRERSAPATRRARRPGRARREGRGRKVAGRRRRRRLPVHRQRAGHGRATRHPPRLLRLRRRCVRQRQADPATTLRGRPHDRLDLRNPDFVAFARASAPSACMPTAPINVRPALEAFTDGGPVVIDVAARPMPDPWPWMIRRRARGRR